MPIEIQDEIISMQYYQNIIDKIEIVTLPNLEAQCEEVVKELNT